MEEEKRLFTITMDIEAEEIEGVDIRGDLIKDILTEDGESLRDAYNKFFRTLYSLRKNLGESEGYGNLFNMDEIPIYFDLVSKNEGIKIGERYINTLRQYPEGIKFSVMLCVSATGEKLPPMVLFKGKNNEYTEKVLKKLTINKSREIYALCCETDWADRTAYIYWLRKGFVNDRF